ncbi:hypothetical protein AUJ67_07570 [Candidatus Desantisbacteria bacterium CG1_02_49_89]|nr:MAG: hypothetical protein AUJ67_07570 [Candidatus Desantisbacteria bacterium CG1_02_49_89]
MIIDAHAHLGKATYPKWSATTKELLAEMDSSGINKAVVFPQYNVVPGDYSEQNQWLAEAIKPFQDRLIGFARINPALKNCPEVLKKSVDLGFKGIKLHSEDEQWCYSPLLGQCLQEIEDHGLPVFLHSSSEILEKMACDFPQVKIIFAHMAGWPPAVWDIAKKHNNIYMECSRIIMPKAYIGGAVKALGADRVVLGSNFPVGDMGFALKRIELAGLTAEDHKKVCGNSMLKILGE